MVPAARGLLVLLTLALSSASSAGRTPTLAPVADGYPYASRCPAAGAADVVDDWRMDMCNCTSYVAWALHANGQRTDWFVPGAMNAWNWPNVARLAGLTVSRTPRVGAVAVWPKLSPPFGHVAYVLGVEPDGGVDVGEYNAPGAPSRFRFDRRDDVDTRAAVFIYVPKVGARVR